MADITFYANPMSRARIIRWMLEEVGQPYDTVQLDYAASMKAPDYLAINPMGKVPAITHGGTVVTECAAICAYLADAFPEANLAPPHGSKARGPYYRWLFFAAGPVEQAVTAKSMDALAPADKAMMVGYGSWDDTMNALEQAVSKTPYIAGDQFTAADVYVGSQIGWGLNFGTIEKRPAFEAYWERLAGRPAAKRADEIDNGLIAEMKAKQAEPAEG